MAIRKRGCANVVFIMSCLAMWRLEELFCLLVGDPRFNVNLIVYPFQTFDEDQRKTTLKELRDFCHAKGLAFFDKTTFESDIISYLNPDIIFYPQLYHNIYNNELDCEKNLDRLIAYVPYGLPTVAGEWMYNSRFMNIVWKLFFPTTLHLEYAKSHSFNHARNMEVVGDPHAAEFIKLNHYYPWKKQDRNKKKVIWAPHFSINEEGYLHRTSFLLLYEVLWIIAKDFKNEIQFVFKPHPRLLSELYLHPEWGKERADAYYSMWQNGENTQLETGQYIDLFCTSDALIHDCGSFTAEYHYTAKPVLFLSTDFQSIYAGLDTFGTLCLDLHYQAHEESEIRGFLREVVLGGNDPLKHDREVFRKKYLLPDGQATFSNNVYRSLTDFLFQD